MKKHQLDGFKESLKAKLMELSDGLRYRDLLAIETSPDELDRPQCAQQRDVAIGTADRESVLLRLVQTALARVENGGFGVCLSCEDDIGAHRLAALPWAMFCIVCQEDADRLLSQAFDQHPSPLLNVA